MTREQKTKEFEKAAECIAKAVYHLRNIETDEIQNKKHDLRYDAAYYIDQLSELLSCDNGQAGLEPFINGLK